MKRTLSTWILAAAAASAAIAGAPREWVLEDQKQFEKGELQNVAIDDLGRLSASPGPERVFTPDGETFVWSLAVSASGVLHAGTAPGAKIFRASKPNEWKELTALPGIAVTALAFGKGGELYAAVMPGGKVFRVGEEGEVREVADTGQRYVWALALDDAGRLLVATGIGARVLRITLGGATETLLDSPEDHILSLLPLPDGGVLAGSSGEGLLYRIRGDGPFRVEVLLDAPQEEIRALARAGDVIYAAAVTGKPTLPASSGASTPQPPSPPDAASTAGSEVSTGSSSDGSNSASGETPAAEPAGEGPAGEDAAATPETRPEDSEDLARKAVDWIKSRLKGAAGKGASRSVPPAVPVAKKTKPEKKAPPPPAGQVRFGRTGSPRQQVYAIGPSGLALPVFSSDQDVILSMVAAGEGLVIGTGSEGVVFRLDGELRTRWFHLEESQVLCMAEGPGGELFMGTGNPGRVYRLDASRRVPGQWTSETLDTGRRSRWGRLTWRLAAGSGVVFRSRSGDSGKPDFTWSDWSDPIGQAGAVESPGARFLQLRAELDPAVPAALLEEVRVVYQPMNAPPSIESFTISTPRVDPFSEHFEPSLKVRQKRVEERKKQPPHFIREVEWKAVDPDSDELWARLELRGLEESDWKPLFAEPTSATDLTWDTRELPDGVYRVRLTVGDGWANAAEESFEDSRVSPVIVIDHSPPEVAPPRIELQGGTALVEVRATDALSRVLMAEYLVANGDWVPAAPVDGLADSRDETFRLRLEGLAPGEHVLSLRARDAAGNVGSWRQTIRVP